MKSIFLILLTIVIFGSFLRIYSLNKESLWNDELSSWKRSNYSTLNEVIEKGVRTDVHPPGYQVMLYFVENYIGEDEFSLRIPSAIAGIFSIFIIFLLGRRFYTAAEGLIASALLAFSWVPIYFSQEARAYSLLLLFALLSTYFWIKIRNSLKEGKNNYIDIILYVATGIAISYLHYFGLLVLAFHGILSLVASSKSIRNLLRFSTIYFAIFAAYIPWLPSFFDQLNKDPIWIKSPGIKWPFQFFYYVFDGSISALLLIFLILSAGVYYGLKGRLSFKQFCSLDNPTFIILMWILIPFLLAFLKSITSAPILTPRNLIIMVLQENLWVKA